MTETVFDQLQDLAWRGIYVPLTGKRPYGFQHSQAKHKFIFRNEQLIESLGAQNPTLRYTIPFRENIQRPPWSNLFTRVYPDFLEACRDGSAGDLQDPVHGIIRAKCVSVEETLDVEKKDGVDVDVTFIYAPEEGDEGIRFGQIADTIQGLAVQAVRFGAAVGELSDEARKQFTDLNKEGERADQSIANTVRQATGFVQQTKQKTRAKLYDAGTRMEVTRREIEEARDPELEPLRRDASRTTLAARRLAQTAGDPTTPWEVVKTHEAIGRLAFATAHGLTIDVLLDHNPSLADMFLIPPGTPVKVPKGG